MAKYLYLASYTASGKQGLLKDGGSKRMQDVKKLVEEAGGKVDSFHFAFGEADAVLIVDLPDATTAAALSLTASASGAVDVRTVPLLSPKEVDAACAKKVSYKPPGA